MLYKRRSLVRGKDNAKASNPSRFEVLQIVIGIVISIATAIIGWKTFALTAQTEDNGEQLKAIDQKLSEDKFDFDRVRDVYDRTEKYLENSEQSASRGRVLVALINRLPDDSARSELLSVVIENAKIGPVASVAASLKKNISSSVDAGAAGQIPTPIPQKPSVSENEASRANGGAANGAFSGVISLQVSPDGREFATTSALSFIDPNGVRWEVPKGATLDGASIPRALWSVIGSPFEGKYTASSALLDWYSDTRTRSKSDTDTMYYNALVASGVSPATAKLLYLSVSNWGPTW